MKQVYPEGNCLQQYMKNLCLCVNQYCQLGKLPTTPEVLYLLQQCEYCTHPTTQNIMDPSDPPLTNRDSWMGCQLIAKITTTDLSVWYKNILSKILGESNKVKECSIKGTIWRVCTICEAARQPENCEPFMRGTRKHARHKYQFLVPVLFTWEVCLNPRIYLVDLLVNRLYHWGL